MKQNRAVNKYAKALYYLANKANTIDDTLKRLNILTTINSSSAEFRYFLKSKRIRSKLKIEIASKVLADILSELEIGLLVHLIDNDETELLSSIIKQFTFICDQSDNTIQVTVTTANNLSEEEKTEFLSTIEKKLNKKVAVHSLMDPSIIGGAKFRIGNMIVDGSISTRLKKLEKSLYEG